MLLVCVGTKDPVDVHDYNCGELIASDLKILV